jgi:broad specificity phosphatase PhoE
VRAEALARVLEGAEIAAIYSSQTLRTESTVRPLSQRIGIAISYGSASFDDPAAYSRQLAAEVLAKHRGQNVVIVNHSNTVPVIVETLSGQAVQPMSDYEYATLFIVTIPPDGPPSVVRAQYGQPDGVAPTAPQAAALHTPATAGGTDAGGNSI